jgi:hypothetical protein
MAYGSEVEKLERRWMENPMGVSFAPLAEAYRRAGDQPRALEVLAIGLANHPAYVPALIVQARCHLDVNADGAAEESFLAVLATDGHNLIALKGLADICERSDRPEQAQKHLDRLLEADPTHDEGRAQMDRLTGVLMERERLRGPRAGTDTLPASGETVSDAEVLEPVEPMGFEPTDAGGFDDHSPPDEIPPLVDSIADAGAESAREEPDAGGVSEHPEPELMESLGWDDDEAEHLAGFEATEPDFEVEKETSPFDAEEDGTPAAPPSLGNAEPAVPFEETLPAPWIEESSAEPMADPFRDELAVEPVVEADTPSAETEAEGESPATEAESSPDVGAFVWAPRSSAWDPGGALETPGQVTPPVEDVRADESPSTEVTGTEQPIEPQLEPEALEPEALEPETPQPEPLEPVAEASETRELTPETAAWLAATSAFAPIEEIVPASGDDAGAETGPSGDDAERPAERSDSVPAWEASTEIQDDLPATDRSSIVEDAEPWEPANWQEPVSEALPTARDADDEVTVVEGAESELPADPEPEIEPALIMTETMARLFERQGHRTMALAIYAQLAEQAPGNPDLAAAVERLTGELSAGSGTPGASVGGAVDAAAVDAIVGRGSSNPPHTQPRALSDPSEPGLRLDAPATRASEDLFSLSAVFGPVRPGPAAQSAVFAPGTEAAEREPSFDEFFESEGSAASDGGRTDRAGGEDLEQFTAWLRSLKR